MGKGQYQDVHFPQRGKPLCGTGPSDVKYKSPFCKVNRARKRLAGFTQAYAPVVFGPEMCEQEPLCIGPAGKFPSSGCSHVAHGFEVSVFVLQRRFGKQQVGIGTEGHETVKQGSICSVDEYLPSMFKSHRMGR